MAAHKTSANTSRGIRNEPPQSDSWPAYHGHVRPKDWSPLPKPPPHVHTKPGEYWEEETATVNWEVEEEEEEEHAARLSVISI